MKLIVGLGNPGPQFSATRHNVGFQVIERTATQFGLTARKIQFNAVVISAPNSDRRILLAKPLTYMNESGRAIGPLVRWLKLELSDLLIVYDELDLPVGKIRLRPGGGTGGHHGMNSVVRHLGADHFPRLRIGVGRPLKGDEVNFLLSDFTPDEQISMRQAYDQAVSAVELFADQGIVAAMNRFN